MALVLETDRLILRQWREADQQPFARMNADPDIMEYIGDGSARTRQQSDDFIAFMQKHWDDFGFGLFAVDRKDTSEFIGFIGLATPTFLPEVLPAVEIGWRLAKTSQGAGFATEGAKSVLKFGFEQRGLSRIISICQPDNIASERVMKKIGMHFWRNAIVPANKTPVKIYSKVPQDQ